MKTLLLTLVFLFGGLVSALALTPNEILKNPELEARARSLSKELRCMVCQNQSIDDSDAQLAKDLRVIVRERLVAGDSDAAILDFVEARYGEFVLLKPRMNAHTIALWASPFLALLGGLWLFLRRKQGDLSSNGAGLSLEEEARIEALIKDQT